MKIDGIRQGHASARQSLGFKCKIARELGVGQGLVSRVWRGKSTSARILDADSQSGETMKAKRLKILVAAVLDRDSVAW